MVTLSSLAFDQNDNFYATGQYGGSTFSVTLTGTVHTVTRQTTQPGSWGDAFLLKSPWPL